MLPGDEDLLSVGPKWKLKHQRTGWSTISSWLGGGNKLKTLKTPYGEVSYIETPEMRWGKSKKWDDSLSQKPYISTLGGTGGGDYLQLANRFQNR